MIDREQAAIVQSHPINDRERPEVVRARHEVTKDPRRRRRAHTYVATISAATAPIAEGFVAKNDVARILCSSGKTIRKKPGVTKYR